MKVKAWLDIGYVGTERIEMFDFTADELEGMSEDEVNAYIEEEVREWAFQHIEWGFTIIEPDPREKGDDDDGVEYADPRDHREGRE